MSEQQLHDRIERLERKMRRLTVASIGLSISLVCIACIAAAPNSNEVIVARGLKIVDAQGNVRADILVDTFDDVPGEVPKEGRRIGLRLFGKDGKVRGRLETANAIDDDGKQQVYTGLVMSTLALDDEKDQNKNAIAAITVESNDARMGVSFGDHSADMSSSTRAGAALYVRDVTSKLKIAKVKPTEIAIEDNSASPYQRSTLNTQRLSIFEGLQGLSLGATELHAKATGDQIKTAPTLVLFDKDGNVTWRAGRQ